MLKAFWFLVFLKPVGAALFPDLNNIDLVSVLDNPIDEVWASDTANPRPEYSDASLFVHEIQYAGEHDRDVY